jgi:hypothetical protein
LSSPSAPQCTDKTSCSLQITWEDADESGESISESRAAIAVSKKRYELQMCQLETGAVSSVVLEHQHVQLGGWNTIATDMLDRVALVSDLLPLRYYCFRTRVYLVDNNIPVNAITNNKDELATASANTSAFSEPSLPVQTLRRC